MTTHIERALAQITPELVEDMRRLIEANPGRDESYLEMTYSLSHDALPGVGAFDPDARGAVVDEIYARAMALRETTRDTAGLGPLPAVARPALPPIATPLYEDEAEAPEVASFMRERIDEILHRLHQNGSITLAEYQAGQKAELLFRAEALKARP